MKKSKLFVGILAFSGLIMAACGETPTPDTPATTHECTHICPTCGKCTDANCTDPVCADKCQGHTTPTPHVCEHVCPTCGKCTDSTCTDPVCADKCTGHEPAKKSYTLANGFLLEAEDGDVAGTMTGTDVTDAFVAERSASNPDEHATSGGKVVFNWAAAGNTVTWTFDLTDSGSAKFTLWCCAGQNQSSSGLGITVNGQSASWKESTVLGKGFSDNMWYYWNPITAIANLVEGENTVVITNISGESWNLDCLNVASYTPSSHVCNHVCPTCGKCTDASCTDEVCADKCQGHTGASFSEGVMRLEAENAELTGGCAAFNSESLSGGKGVGDFTYESHIIFKFTMTEAGSYKLRISYACGQENNYNGAVEVEVNGTHVQGTTHHDGNNFGALCDGWDDYKVETSEDTFELKIGENTIDLIGAYGSYTNIDYVEVVVDKPAHVCNHVCEECGGCTDKDCTDPACANKCTCGEAGAHTCSHVCEFCGKCTDSTCTDEACAEKCSCNFITLTEGKYRFEAEDAVLAGGCSVGNGNGTELVSGDKVVGDFNNSATITFNVVAKADGVYDLSVRYACGLENNYNGAVEVTLDGNKVNGTVMHDGNNFGEKTDWHDWATDTSSSAIKLTKGAHTIVLSAPYGSYTNVDYIELSEHAHTCEHVCEVCGKCMDATCTDLLCEEKCSCNYITFTEGKCRFEAEDGALAGGCSVGNGNGTEVVSGDKIVGDFNNSATITFTFVVSADGVYDLGVRYACGLENNYNGAVEVSLDGNKVNGTVMHDGNNFGEKTDWHDWATDTSSSAIKLTKGAHTIVLSAPYGSYTNVDYIELSEHVHTCEHVCPYCQKCMDDTCTDVFCEEKCSCKYVTFTEGKYRVEAENYDGNSNQAVAVNTSDSASGGKTVGDFMNQAELTYKVYVTEATTVKISVCYGLGINGGDNGAVELYVNGERVHGANSDDNIGMSVTGWACETVSDSATFELVAGENTIKLCSPWGSCVNLDYFDIVVVAAE